MEESGIAVASTSLLGVGCVTSALGLVDSSRPGVMDRIQPVRREDRIVKKRGAKRIHMDVRS